MIQETAPLDAMLLVHTAMAGSAEKVEREADRLEEGSSLQPFRAAFNEWATALMYLSEREDELFGDHHSHAATPEDDSQAAMLAANSDEHREMDEKFQDVMDVLNGPASYDGRANTCLERCSHYGLPSRTTSKTNAPLCCRHSSSG